MNLDEIIVSHFSFNIQWIHKFGWNSDGPFPSFTHEGEVKYVTQSLDIVAMMSHYAETRPLKRGVINEPSLYPNFPNNL